MSYETGMIERTAPIRGRRVPTKAACLRTLPDGLSGEMRRSAVRGVITTYDRRGPFAAMSQAKQIQDAFETLDIIERSIA